MKKLTVRLQLTMLVLLLSPWITSCSSYKVVSADREMLPVKASQSFNPPSDGFFVPDALWRDIAHQLTDKALSTNTPAK